VNYLLVSSNLIISLLLLRRLCERRKLLW